MGAYSRLQSSPRLTQPIGHDDHTRGPESAPVTLVEYGDFQCPYCGVAFPVVEALLAAEGDNVRFAFRHFPLTELHQFAAEAAEAAEAAGAQDKFWEMHHALFSDQRHLNRHSLVERAQQLGLDVDAFSAELDNETFLQRVERDFVSGVRSGVNGTPTFFINGQRYDGAAELDSLTEAVQAAR